MRSHSLNNFKSEPSQDLLSLPLFMYFLHRVPLNLNATVTKLNFIARYLLMKVHQPVSTSAQNLRLMLQTFLSP